MTKSATFTTMIRVKGIGAIAHVNGILDEGEVLKVARDQGYEVVKEAWTQHHQSGIGMSRFWNAS